MTKKTNRCAASARGACCSGGMSRRSFLGAVTTSSVLLAGTTGAKEAGETRFIKPCGPASRYKPKVAACFVRRKEPYGMWWPGQIFDGEAVRKKCIEQTRAAAGRLGLDLQLRETPLHSAAEFDAWFAETTAAKPDGLFVVLLDRQRHAWPSAAKAVASGVPTVIFTPVGTCFTTNTARLAEKPGCMICATDDFRQAEFGLKALAAAAKLRQTRCLVIRGRRRFDTEMADLGVKLRYVPARTFIDAYKATPVDERVRAMAAELVRGARRRWKVSDQDVINGIKSYMVAAKLLEQEECDAITMDCLGALGSTQISLPCIAWSKMNDEGVPAACEADLGAVASHIIVQYLFDRPGFQQDPVPETVENGIIGAHCTCATRLAGFHTPPEPYNLTPHHGMRDATRRVLWREGQRVTAIDVLPGKKGAVPTKILLATGEVVRNIAVPPAGGCVVSVLYRIDGLREPLTWPGFHQVFFYGDFRREMKQFCRLAKVEVEEV